MPRQHTVKVQPYPLLMRAIRGAPPAGGLRPSNFAPGEIVRIVVFLRHPRIHPVGIDAEFFVQLARKRPVRRLAALDFSPGEFPVTLPRLARRALRQQYPSVLALQDRDGDIEHLLAFDHGVHDACVTSFQATVSPARSGTRVSSPNARSPDTAHGSFTSVTLSRLRGRGEKSGPKGLAN